MAHADSPSTTEGALPVWAPTGPSRPVSEGVTPSWVRADPWLVPHLPMLRARHAAFEATLRAIEVSEGSLDRFVREHGLHYLGLHPTESGWVFREWAPSADAAALVGDFNQWDVTAHPCEFNAHGVWEVHVRHGRQRDGIGHLRIGSKFKVALRHLDGPQGHGHSEDSSARPTTAESSACACNCSGTSLQSQGWVFATPAWALQCSQDPVSHEVCAVVPRPLNAYPWKSKRPPVPESLRIYEVHAGIGTAQEAIGTWRQLRRDVLPHAHALGYSALLLLGMQVIAAGNRCALTVRLPRIGRSASPAIRTLAFAFHASGP